MELNKRYNPRSRWASKYRKDVGLWIPSRKMTYLYWFKFLQIAEKEPERKVDWKKYDEWGGKEFVMETKFDDWWRLRWMDCFGIEKEGDTPRYPLTTKRPKIDAIRYALRLYEYKHLGDTWKIALHFKKNEKRMYFLDFFAKIDEKIDANSTPKLLSDDPRKQIEIDDIYKDKEWIGGHSGNWMDEDSEAYLNFLQKKEVRIQVARYLRKAEDYLNNVCEGKFP
tara:strand:- start:686 stop:1357 length:672 start_codon:yes stop_codon:yes gene_type:complete